ncbi:hypothetical protein S245_024727 [Arachis hypogaea]
MAEEDGRRQTMAAELEEEAGRLRLVIANRQRLGERLSLRRTKTQGDKPLTATDGGKHDSSLQRWLSKTASFCSNRAVQSDRLVLSQFSSLHLVF